MRKAGQPDVAKDVALLARTMIGTLGGAMFSYLSKRPGFDRWQVDVKAHCWLARADTQARRPKTRA